MKRRDFIKLTMAAGALGLAPRSLLAADTSGYKCLVNIFLFGGNDAFNLIAPTSAAEYAVYADSRQNLSIAQEDLLPITPLNPDGATYGLHPSAAALQTLFEAGDAAVIANIGPLIEPVTKSSFQNQSVQLPPQLFSHNDQQDQWQTLKGLQSISTGWAGRIADSIAAETAAQQLALNTSTFGTTIFQAGATTVPYTVGTSGANTYGAFSADAGFGAARRAAFETYLDTPAASIHGRALGEVHKRSLATADLVNEGLAKVPELTTEFPASFLGAQLRIIARLIAVKDEFDMSRQIFFAGTGGFDTHDNQNTTQPDLFSDLAASMAAFNTAMIEIGQADNVVLFTQSDFGRTLTSNGDGTDHGWGSHQFVMGAPVIGQRIYGDMPILEIGGEDDSGAGRIIPTQSVDQYAATLARWFGVDDENLANVSPNLANFTNQSLGFLG